MLLVCVELLDGRTYLIRESFPNLVQFWVEPSSFMSTICYRLTPQLMFFSFYRGETEFKNVY